MHFTVLRHGVSQVQRGRCELVATLTKRESIFLELVTVF